MSTPASPAPARRALRLVLGLLFLLAALCWGAYAVLGLRGGPGVEVLVRVQDARGQPLPKALVRTRYGGAWTPLGPEGTLRLRDPSLREDPDVAAALADALQAKAAFHARRPGTAAQVVAAGDGRWQATLVLEPCGMLRVGVAPSGFASARARLDPDGPAGRWCVVEGSDVVRAGEAATWAVFAGAPPSLWATLEGDRGVAQVRIELPVPSLGQLLERSLGPEPALPIRGRVRVAGDARLPSLHGMLEVEELREGRPPLARPSVRVEPDGRFAVEYAGRGRYRVRARLAFAHDPQPVEALAGAEGVLLEVQPRPWAELGPAALAQGARDLSVSVHGADGVDRLPAEGALPTASGLCVALPGAGDWHLVLSAPGTDEAPPRAGEVRVQAPAEGPVQATATLDERPHGGVELEVRGVPERGGEVRLHGRVRTLLARVGTRASIAHLPTGSLPLRVSWRDPTLAEELLEVEVRAGETTRVDLAATPGGRVRIDASGTFLAGETRLALRLVAGASPYGRAEGLVGLVREGGTGDTGGASIFASGVALRPGEYHARVHREGDGTHWLAVHLQVEAGKPCTVRATEP